MMMIEKIAALPGAGYVAKAVKSVGTPSTKMKTWLAGAKKARAKYPMAKTAEEEKSAARGGPKHLFGLWKRVFSETARKRSERVFLRRQSGERFSRTSPRAQPTQDIARSRAAKATKREFRKLKEKARPFAIPAATAGAAAGAAYLGARAAGSKKEKKGQ